MKCELKRCPKGKDICCAGCKDISECIFSGTYICKLFEKTSDLTVDANVNCPF